jgi:hypothetical protein
MLLKKLFMLLFGEQESCCLLIPLNPSMDNQPVRLPFQTKRSNSNTHVLRKLIYFLTPFVDHSEFVSRLAHIQQAGHKSADPLQKIYLYRTVFVTIPLTFNNKRIPKEATFLYLQNAKLHNDAFKFKYVILPPNQNRRESADCSKRGFVTLFGLA